MVGLEDMGVVLTPDFLHMCMVYDEATAMKQRLGFDARGMLRVVLWRCQRYPPLESSRLQDILPGVQVPVDMDQGKWKIDS
jgi:hypothetical protein